ATVCALDANQHPGTCQLFSTQGELQLSGAECSVDIGDFGRPRSVVPQHDRATSVFPFRNHAFKLRIVYWMIFHVSGEPLHRWIERWSLRNRPGKQHAAPLQPKIVMKMRGLMLLDDE